MTPLEAIRSATVTAGAVVGGGVGILEPGRPADLIVVAEDPTNDLARLRRPRSVMRSGRLVDLDWAERTVRELQGVIADPGA
jgi:imidazolonepropionase-like amidohydrolase